MKTYKAFNGGCAQSSPSLWFVLLNYSSGTTVGPRATVRSTLNAGWPYCGCQVTLVSSVVFTSEGIATDLLCFALDMPINCHSISQVKQNIKTNCGTSKYIKDLFTFLSHNFCAPNNPFSIFQKLKRSKMWWQHNKFLYFMTAIGSCLLVPTNIILQLLCRCVSVRMSVFSHTSSVHCMFVHYLMYSYDS